MVCEFAGIGNHKLTNAYFIHFILNIYESMEYFRTKFLLLYNFKINCFPVYCTVFHINAMTPNFRATSAVISLIGECIDPLARQHFYHYNFRHSKVKGVRKNIIEQSVYYSAQLFCILKTSFTTDVNFYPITVSVKS